MKEPAELKRATVSAEELNKLVFETTLTPEQKLLILALRLHDGELKLTEMPKSTGTSTYEVARRTLNRRKICVPSVAGKRRAKIADDAWLGLEPKLKKGKKKNGDPTQPKTVEPATEQPEAPESAGNVDVDPERSGTDF